MNELKPSKSARKREHIALQKLGEELITLKQSDSDSLPLEDNLRDAILEAQKIKSNGDLRRQKQYIGKRMRSSDPEPLRSESEKVRR